MDLKNCYNKTKFTLECHQNKNIVTGFFGGMGGCAMIGQSMININNGAVKRLSGIATALFLASFVLFLSQWIEMIPLAALIGVMFVVAEKTFEWGSFRLFGKVPKKDIFVGLLVGAVTVIADLAIKKNIHQSFFKWSKFDSNCNLNCDSNFESLCLAKKMSKNI